MRRTSDTMLTVAETRYYLGYKQAVMADLLGMSVAYVSKLEKDERPMTPEIEKRCHELISEKETINEIQVSIDWFRLRLRTLDFVFVIEQLLGIDTKLFYLERHGGYSYKYLLTYGNIRVYYTDRIEMGTLIEFTGQGCRQFESELEMKNRTWGSFFKDIWTYNSKFNNGDKELMKDFLRVTRMDIALDELYDEANGNYDLFELYSKVRQKEVYTKKTTFEVNEGFDNTSSGFMSRGLSLYFGKTKNTDFYLNCYEKDLEQCVKYDLPLSIIHETSRFKNRYEIRMANDKSTQVFIKLIDDFDKIIDIGKEIVNTMITVFDGRDIFGRRKLDERWLSVFGSNKSYKFVSKPKVWDYDRFKKYYKTSLAGTIKFVRELDELEGYGFFDEINREAQISKKHSQILEMEKEMRIVGLRDYVSRGDKFEIAEQM